MPTPRTSEIRINAIRFSATPCIRHATLPPDKASHIQQQCDRVQSSRDSVVRSRYNQCCDPGSNRGTRLVHKSTLRRVLRQHMRIRLGEWSVAVDVSLATALTICTIAAVAIDLMGDKRYPPWDS